LDGFVDYFTPLLYYKAKICPIFKNNINFALLYRALKRPE
jgi:hypothetical protein